MKSLGKQVSIYFGVIMVLVVVAGAIAFAFTDFLSDRLYGNKRTIFIWVLISYALYRGYRLYHQFKERDEN